MARRCPAPDAVVATALAPRHEPTSSDSVPPGASTPSRQRGRASPPPDPLSRREAQVLDLIARGFTYTEIAGQMAVSVTTVQTHVRNIYGKLGVHSKTEAVYEARQAGWLP